MYGPREFGIDMFFFFEQNSGQVWYVQMWCPQFCSIEEKGLCPSMVLREFCNLEAWPKRRLLEVGWFAGRGCVPVHRQCVRRSMEEPLKLFSTRPRCYMLLNPILSVIKVCHFFLLLCPDEYLDITIWVLCHMGECIICLLYSDCYTTIVYDLDGIWVDVVF